MNETYRADPERGCGMALVLAIALVAAVVVIAVLLAVLASR